MPNYSRRSISQMLGLGLVSSALLPPSVLAQQSVKKADTLKLAFSSWCFHMQLWRGEITADELPVMARNLGVDALEWTAKTFRDLKGGREVMFQAPPAKFFQQLRRASDSEGVAGHVLNVGGPFFLASADDKVQQKALDYILQYVEPAQLLGSKILRTELYFDGERKPGWQVVAKQRALVGIRKLLEQTEGSGLTINVENHHGISSHPEWLAELMASINHPRFGLTVDTNNFRTDLDNPYSKDTNSIPHYVDRYQGLDTLMPWANWVSTKCYHFDSTGHEISMDYPQILAVIARSGYQGYISVEYEGSEAPLIGVEKSLAMLRKLYSFQQHVV